jgi:fructosamine-3-kinase
MIHNKLLSVVFTENLSIVSSYSVSGGSINQTYVLRLSNNKEVFVKENTLDFYHNFYQEQTCLDSLRSKSRLIVPKVIALLKDESKAYLLLEKLERATENNHFYEKLGKGLAELHLNTSKYFGWEFDNYIGSLPQKNKPHSTWDEFFINQRLEPLFNWCYNIGYLDKSHLSSIDRLYGELNSIFPNEKPSLLHGDFWTGNRMSTLNGPAIFDPSCYYGHREMDIAMANLFGRLPDEFYNSYNEVYPLEKDFRNRMDVCNLYPLLVHARLFGKSYMADVKAILKRFN